METRESLNRIAWKLMQQRLESIRQRKQLILNIKEHRKALVILESQVDNLGQKKLGNNCKKKKDELRSSTSELRQYQSEYLKLASNEMSILKSHLKKTINEIELSEIYDMDLEDRRFSLQHTIWTLQQEMGGAMKSSL